MWVSLLVTLLLLQIDLQCSSLFLPMSFKKCCLTISALLFIGAFLFVVVMLGIKLQDYSSHNDKQADLISNYNNWRCYDLCGSDYPSPSASDFCCNQGFTGCRFRIKCRDDMQNQLDDQLSDIVEQVFFYGVATGIMLYGIFKIARAVCRERSRRRTYFIRQSEDNYYADEDIRHEPAGEVQAESQQEQDAYDGINGLRESFVCKDKENSCAICMDALNVDKVIVLTCMHMFHSECIRAWISKDNSCPVCRMPN